jgi:L-xylulokinase
MKNCVIGIDAGGTMTKAALFDFSGRELACARRKNVMAFPHSGWTERDPEVMWQAAVESIREVLTLANCAPEDVAAVSVAGYGSGLYIVDDAANPVRAGIVSTDSRAASLVEEWIAGGLSAAVEPLIHQRIWSGQSIALLGWLQRHEPGVMKPGNHVLFCKDFLRAKLCGDFSTDPSDAGIAGLIDVTTSTYSTEALRILGLLDWLPLLPPIGPPCDVVGGITSKTAALTGLLEGTPVVRGVVDVTAAALSSGLTRPEEMSVVAGTFSINSTLHTTPRQSLTPFLQTPYPLGGYLATEGAATSASNLEWMVKTLLCHGGALPDEQVACIYDVINAAVSRKLGKPREALFFPFLFGGPRGAPAGLVGMTADYSFDDITHAVFEGIVFAHKVDVDRLLSGNDAAHPQVIRLAGGASRSELWSEMFADILGLPVEIPEGSELGALGVAICAAAGIGAYPSLKAATTAMTSISRRYEGDAVRATPYLAKYPRYLGLSDALAEAWSTPEPTGVQNV